MRLAFMGAAGTGTEDDARRALRRFKGARPPLWLGPVIFLLRRGPAQAG